MNPVEEGPTSPFTFEVYVSWDADAREPRGLMTSSSEFIIPESAFLHDGQEITDLEMEATDPFLGGFEENLLSLMFTPATSLPL